MNQEVGVASGEHEDDKSWTDRNQLSEDGFAVARTGSCYCPEFGVESWSEKLQLVARRTGSRTSCSRRRERPEDDGIRNLDEV